MGFEIDAFLLSFRSVKCEKGFQPVFTHGIVWSWPAYLHNVEQFLDCLRLENFTSSHSVRITERHCLASVFFSHKEEREKHCLSVILLCVA